MHWCEMFPMREGWSETPSEPHALGKPSHTLRPSRARMQGPTFGFVYLSWRNGAAQPGEERLGGGEELFPPQRGLLGKRWLTQRGSVSTPTLCRSAQGPLAKFPP